MAPADEQIELTGHQSTTRATITHRRLPFLVEAVLLSPSAASTRPIALTGMGGARRMIHATQLPGAS
ncbi:MAG TPA: hypothetical protein VMT10_13610 [Solirubrobacteraceae bacterium]|nr:hypothetical protein [Solirubrobacteraceae bacterium]